MAQQPRLNADMLVRKSSVLMSKDEIPPEVKPPAKVEERRVNVSFRPRASMHLVLKRIAFEEDRKIQDICEEAVTFWLENRPKEGA